MMLNKAIATLLIATSTCIAAQAEITTTAPADSTGRQERARQKRQEELARKNNQTMSENFDKSSFDIDIFSKEYQRGFFNPQKSFDLIKKEEATQRGEAYKLDYKHWYSRLSLSANIGYHWIAPLGDYEYNPSVSFGASAMYHFNRLHALRLSANFSRHTSLQTKYSLLNLEGDISYVFNLTNYLFAPSDKRWLDVSPTIGGGFSYTSSGDFSRVSPHARFGLNLSHKLSSNSYLFVEPYIEVADDHFDRSPHNQRAYDIEYGLWGGIRIDLDNENVKQRRYKADFNPNLFMDFTVGANFYWLNNASNTFKYSMGGIYSVSAGKWLDHLFGTRVGLNIGDFYWKGRVKPALIYGNTQVREQRSIFYRGIASSARIELLYRPLDMFKYWREHSHRFELDLAAGFELGYYSKGAATKSGRMNSIYTGYTLAADAMYRIAPNSWIFIEPRVSFLNYNVKGALDGKEGSFTDRTSSINVGVRIQHPTKSEAWNMFPEEFRRGLQVGVYGGGVKFISTRKYQTDYPTNWLAGLSFTYHLTPYHAVMLEGEFDQISRQFETTYRVKSGKNSMRYTGYVTRTHNVLTGKLGYRLNVSNWISKRNWDRRHFNLYWIAGPCYAMQLESKVRINDGELIGGNGEPKLGAKNYKGVNSFGLFTGFITSYSLTKNLSVNVRPEATYMMNSLVKQGQHVNTCFYIKVDAGLEWRF